MLYPDRRGSWSAEKREFITKRVAQVRAEMQADVERQRSEFSKLRGREDMLSWLRATLQRKRVGEGKLVPSMDSDRSGTITMRLVAQRRGGGAVTLACCASPQR